MNEYNLWEPIIDIPYNDLYFFGIRDDLGKLIISLKLLGSNEKLLEIKFSGVQAYRVVQEGARLKSLGESPSLRGFRVSTNSDFIEWFKEESLGQFDDWGLTHYVICNTDNIIDVIGGPPVMVEWVSS
ncbi:hypothetical protein CPT03_16845 [Pedobacter ginsengisoli]|uniref:Uncharacterized protein n=1 Tax=Pedobacter ginsengisoli TaxID=363852 RepID=A0A2D1U8S7_9SPHI|nr:hypothetical protein [Pedobacter ginsengisoli]ATP58013.1 hypothetical protein CPT03_16845 [Pedobacter ginsengisoli]